MIRGYAEQPSPRPGQEWTLRVATDAPAWRARFYRCGAGLVPCGSTAWYGGTDAPPHLPGQDWGAPGTGLDGEPIAPWPARRLTVPSDWTSGVYLVVLEEGDRSGAAADPPVPLSPDARSGTALLVVRSAAPGRDGALLYKLPVLTYHAYNLASEAPYEAGTGGIGWCFYNPPRYDVLPEHVRPGVSLHRPGGGTGGHTYDVGNWDPYDPTPRQTFVHWDAPFLAWLEREGYAVEVCTDVDLHRGGGALLAPYRLMVSAGHDEYWSRQMRDAAEAFVADGGRLAFFSGNTVWWEVVFDRDGVVYRRTRPWHETGRPENALTGVSFRNGGERDRDEHPERLGFRVQHADSWVYAGTGLRDGDLLGAAEHLVGYECDGALVDRTDLAAGRPVTATGQDGTPPEFVVLGVADVRAAGWGLGNGAATMGFWTRGGGTVFSGSTTDWARVLGGGRDPAVEQVTRNVLDRLGARRGERAR